MVVSAAAVLWLLTSNPMLLFVALVCGYRLFTKDWQVERDNTGLLQFVGLLASLALLAQVAPMR